MGWGSTEVIVVGALGIALIGAFVFAESRAREPVLPLELLRDRLFVVCGTLSFIVGFALFGSVTFLPLYFQTVDGASPTGAGLRLVAMIGGLLVMSILSGQLISRTGRYKVFPVMGTALMAIGLVLLSRLDVGASVLIASAYLLVLGLGLGAVMQVLVLAVQNAVDYSMLGAATSAVTLARGMGGSLGTAVFGSIFTSQLRAHLKNALTGSLGHQVASGGRLTGAQVVKLPPPVRHVYENAYVLSLRPVLLVAGGVAALGFVLSLLIQQRPLREAATASTGLEDSMAAPRSSDSLAEIERSLTKLTTLDERRRFRTEVAARSGLDISPGAIWALVQIDEHGFARARGIAEANGVNSERIAQVLGELRDRGLLAGEDGDGKLTNTGTQYTERLLAARRELLSEALASGDGDRPPELTALLRRLARELCGEPPVAQPAGATA